MAGTLTDDLLARSADPDAGSPSSGWPAIDLRAVLGALPVSRSGSGPTNAAATWCGTTVSAANGALVLSLTDAPAGALAAGALPPVSGKRLRRPKDSAVPRSAFVCIGRLTGPLQSAETVPLKSGKARTANDNFVAPGARKSLWRELFFLAVLAVTLAGMFWTGRMQGYQKIIVVPGPSSYHSVVT